jgi:integrase
MPEKLTDLRVRNAPTRRTRYSILDAREGGLELRIHPDGRRIFALRRSVRGKDVRVTIGPYGQEMPAFTLERARTEAAALKLRFRQEGDYRESEQAAHAAEQARRRYTIDNLADDWLAHARKRLRTSTLTLHTCRIDAHIRPALGSRPVSDISRSEVREFINTLGEQRAVTANRCAQLLSTLFKFARSELERDIPNPAADIKPFREAPRTRILTDDEIRSFSFGLENPAMPPGARTAIALKIALYSCQRIGEIIGARDNELCFEDRVWIVPGVRTKSGRENHVPLTPKLAALFKQAQALRHAPTDREKREYVTAERPVFPAPSSFAKPMQRHSASQGMARLCTDHLEWKSAATPHDLRRTGRTLLARERLGVSYEDAERVMSHVTGSPVSRVYIVANFLPEKRRTLERLGIELDRIIAGEKIDDAHNVLDLRAARASTA